MGRDAAALELRQWETRHSQGFSAVVCSLPRRERLTHPLPAAPAATPRRGAVESDPSRGTTQLLGLAHDGKEAQGTEQQNSREGTSPAAGKNRSNTPKSLSSILPTHGTTSPLRFQPGKKGAGKEKRKEGSRSSSQGTGTLQGTALDPAAPGTPCLHTASESYFHIHSSSLFWKSQKITELAALSTCASAAAQAPDGLEDAQRISTSWGHCPGLTSHRARVPPRQPWPWATRPSREAKSRGDAGGDRDGTSQRFTAPSPRCPRMVPSKERCWSVPGGAGDAGNVPKETGHRRRTGTSLGLHGSTGRSRCRHRVGTARPPPQQFAARARAGAGRDSGS